MQNERLKVTNPLWFRLQEPSSRHLVTICLMNSDKMITHLVSIWYAYVVHWKSKWSKMAVCMVRMYTFVTQSYECPSTLTFICFKFVIFISTILNHLLTLRNNSKNLFRFNNEYERISFHAFISNCSCDSQAQNARCNFGHGWRVQFSTHVAHSIVVYFSFSRICYWSPWFIS